VSKRKREECTLVKCPVTMRSPASSSARIGCPFINFCSRTSGFRRCVCKSISGVIMIASMSSHHIHSASGYLSKASRIAGILPHTGCVVCVMTYVPKSTVMKS